MDVIKFSKNKDAYGWLSNMSPYPIVFGNDTYRTSEALFQALRFSDSNIQALIRAEKSPMTAKQVMRDNHQHLVVEKHSSRDVNNMIMCLKLKLTQHPKLIDELINTGDALIVEDVTSRGDVDGNLFWGAMLVDGEWVGKNTLGKCWMDLRTAYKNIAT